MIGDEVIKEIEEYETKSLVISILNALKLLEFEERNFEKNWPFWNFFTLLKWSLIHSGKQKKLRLAHVQDVFYLAEIIEKIKGEHDFYPGKEHEFDLNKFMALIAYHQSYFQLSVRKDSFARQIIIYNQLTSKSKVENDFFQLTGLLLNEFIIASFILWAYTENSDSYGGLIRADLNDLINMTVPGKADIFLNLISLDFQKAPIIKEENKVKNPCLQVFEWPIFTRYPIFDTGIQKVIIHKKLLNYFLNFYTYDLLKNRLGEEFSDEFGRRLERYIELGLIESGVSFKNESLLKKDLKRSSNCVDYIVNDNILIECKAIEQKPYPSIYPSSDVLVKWLKSSLIKAYCKQMLSVANQLSREKEFFGIIVTHKETHFGTGKDAWVSFLNEPAHDFAEKNNLDINVLPPEWIYRPYCATHTGHIVPLSAAIIS